MTVVTDQQKLRATINENLADYLANFKPNATFKKAPEMNDYLSLNVVKAAIHSLSAGQSYLFLGEAGIGKTSFTKWLIEEVLGFEFVYIPAAQISVENLMVPFPRDDPEFGAKVLDMLFFSKFATDAKKVILIDEIGRADSSLGNTLMEILQEGTLAGKPIKGLVSVLAADNPSGAVYGKMSSLDYSQADRFATVILSSTDTPWRRALAAQYDKTDLTGVFKVYDTITKEARQVLNPRVLSFVISALQAGFPGVYALPMVNGKRQLLSDAKDATYTSQLEYTRRIIDRIAAALGVASRESVPDVVEKAIAYALAGNNIYMQGPPGCGKTSKIKEAVKRLNVVAHYDSAAVLSPEDLSIPFPSADGTTLELMPTAKFTEKQPWIWIVDEITRASRRTQNALMEPLQERTVGGIKTNLVATIALNNPPVHNGMKLNVGKSDLAQASRFALSIEIDGSDINWEEFLLTSYGEEVASPFIEWYQDDLDDIGRGLLSPRGLERLIKTYIADVPLDWGLAYIDGARIGVSLVDLNLRLSKRPIARLRKIISEVDQYEAKFASAIKAEKDAKDAGKASTPAIDVNPEEQSQVFLAFQKAELMQLKKSENYPAVVRLYTLLDSQHKIALLREAGKDRMTFWNDILIGETVLDKDGIVVNLKGKPLAVDTK